MGKPVYNIEAKIPLNPGAGVETVFKVDGLDLSQHMTSLCIRAGGNGYTNAVVELATTSSIELISALLVNVSRDTPEDDFPQPITQAVRIALSSLANDNAENYTIKDLVADSDAVDFLTRALLARIVEIAPNI